jgi:hypothetical protein
MDFKLAANEGEAIVEGWLRDIGTEPKSVTAPIHSWAFVIAYPANTSHRITVAHPLKLPRALVVATRVMFSPEHLQAFRLLIKAQDKTDFLEALQRTLNREFVEFTYEGADTPLTCPSAFQITATRFEDGLSLDSLARTVSSVYKAELAALMCVRQYLGRRDFPGTGGDIQFAPPRIQ